MLISKRYVRLRAGLLTLLALVVFSLVVPSNMFAQVAPQITAPIDDNQLIELIGNTHPLANASNDRGTVTSSLPMKRMLLVLKRSVAQDKALAKAIEDMHRQRSKSFHQWLTPEQIGLKYGAAQQDINIVSTWLTGAGFNVTSVSKARSVIEFSGTAQAVSSAFHTEIHSYAWKGQTYTANSRNPKIPTALSGIVAGFAALNNFPATAMHTPEKLVKFDKQAKTWSVVSDVSKKDAPNSQTTQKAKPDFTTTEPGIDGNVYAVTPWDFATIYNVKPLWDNNIDGLGQHIAIVAESDINPADVDQFRNAFNLPAKKLNIIYNGPNPGPQADEGEAAIDAEWSGAIAKNATIDFVVSGTTNSTQGVDLSALYIIDNQVAPVMSESYGYCELGLGVAGNLFYYQLWQQAAAQGITAIVAAGDSGSATCDAGGFSAQYGLAVSGFASTPYTVTVGGTDFEVSETNPTKYWSGTNAPKTQESALSYIPEIPWNGSCASPEVFAVYGSYYGDPTPEALCNDSSAPQQVVGGGGGASNCVSYNSTYDPNNLQPTQCAAGYPKPEWQAGVNGIPDDKARDLPDVSLFASDNTFRSFYLYCESDAYNLPSPTCDYTNPDTVYYLSAGGTSFGAPAFAGIMALVNQKTQSSQGLANYVLYSLAGQQYGNSTSPNTTQTKACNASSDQAVENSCTFYDISEGSIAQPCVNGTTNCLTIVPSDLNGILSGYIATAGYDLATGLGSVNAENLVNNWAAYSIGATTTSLTASPATTTYGQAVTLAGSVTASSGSGTPTGEIVVQSPQQNPVSFPLGNGVFSQPVSTFLAGSYNIEASFLGNDSFAGSISSPLALTINKAVTRGTLLISAANVRSGEPIASNKNQIPYGTAIVGTLTVAGNTGAPGVLAPTGSVVFTSGGSTFGNSTLINDSASAQSVAGRIADYSLSAVYQGDSNYNFSPAVTVNYSVVQAPTSLEAHSSTSTVPTGGTATIIATVTTLSSAAPPTGTISFYVNGNSVGSANLIQGADPITFAGLGTATLTIPSTQLTAGTNELTATYLGDSNFVPSNSGPSSFVYLSGAQSSRVTLTTSGATATNTTAVTLSAAVTVNGAPASLGSVSFLDNGKQLAEVPIVGLLPSTGATPGTAKLIIRLPSGTHSIFARYNGVGNAIPPTASSVATITITGSQITTTSFKAVNDVGTPANYDVTATVIAGGYTLPTGTITLLEPSLNTTLKTATLDPTTGTYGLAPESLIPTGGLLAQTITGDFNGDGIPDIAVSRGEPNPSVADPFPGMQLVIYLGKGDGTFQPGIGSVVSGDPDNQQPFGMAASDFNADGIPDIAFGFRFGGNIFILLGNGDGTFHRGATISVPVPAGGYSDSIENLVIGDYNKDGIQDIAFANDNGLSIEVIFGNGDGSFNSNPTVIPDAGGSAYMLMAGDVNNDGNLDLVATRYYDNSIAVIFGNGDGSFQNEVIYPAGNLPLGGDLGDLNRDGYLDIVVSDQQDGTVSVLLNNGDGTFGSATPYDVDYHFNDPTNYFPQPQDVKIADMNGDRKLDVVIADAGTNQLTVLNGLGDGTLQPYEPIFFNTGILPQQLVLTDLNNDGVPDVVTNESGASATGVLLNGRIETVTLRNLALDGASTEQETVTATYSGDSANNASTSAAITLPGSGTQVATKLDWSASAHTGVFGTAIPTSALNAQVENNIPGTITYSAQLAEGASIPVTSGTSLPTAGPYTITATFTPNSTIDYAPSTASIAFSVTKASVTETLTSSVAQAAQGANVTLTDALVSKTTGTPTGLVTFYSGTTSLGSATIDKTGMATISTTSLPFGTASITASYLGDGNFNSDASAAISVTSGSPTIIFAAGQSALTISAGSTGTDTLTVTPQLGFTGNVVFTCGNLPAGSTCSFAPASGAVGTEPLQSTLTVATTAPSTTSATQSNSATRLIVGSGVAGLASVLLIGLPRRRKRITTRVALLLVVATTVLYTGCGGSSKHTPAGPTTSTLALSSSAIKSASGTSLTLETKLTGADASTATGSFIFYDGTTQIGEATVANGSAQITLNNLSVGAHRITAKYAGDSLTEASTSNGIEQVITGQASFTVTATSGAISQSSTVNLTLQ